MNHRSPLVLCTVLQHFEHAYRSGIPEQHVWHLMERMGFTSDDLAAAVLREVATASARVRPYSPKVEGDE